LIVAVDMSPSIGTPPRFIQPPSINDTRLVIPSLTQSINNKWDSISLSDGMNFFISEYLFYSWIFCSSGPSIGNDPLNLSEILQSVAPATFGSNSIRK
jgi:hypothetical protein